MTIALVTPQGIIRDEDLALEKATHYETEADRLTAAGKAVQARVLLQRASVIRMLWDL